MTHHHLHFADIHLWAGVVGMIAAMDEYVETLPKMRRAFMAAALLAAGGFGVGVWLTNVGVRRDIARFDVEHQQIFGLIAEDKTAVHDMRISNADAIGEVTDALNRLTCDIHAVPNARCEWWIANGRPDL